MILTALSNLRRRISSAFPTTKLRRNSSCSSTIVVEEPFDKVFKDTKLLNLVATYFFANNAASEFCKCVKTFLGKAQDGERIVAEALRGFEKEGKSDSSVERTLNELRIFKPCFITDESFSTEHFFRKRGEYCKHIAELERMIESSYSTRTLISAQFSTLCHYAERIYVLEPRYGMISLLNEAKFALGFSFPMILHLMREVEPRMRSMSISIKNGEVENLEEELKKLKNDIEYLEEWTKDFDQAVENGRSLVCEKITELLSNVSESQSE